MRFKFGVFGINEADVQTIEVLAPIVYFSSVLIGTLFYSWINGWSIDISYYYATQVLLGSMYGVPAEPNEYSQIFTLFYFIWGTSLLAAAISAMANQIVTNTIKNISEERATALDYVIQHQASREPFTSSRDVIAYYVTEMLVYIGWYDHKLRYITALAAGGWFLLGVIYGMWFEGWTVFHSGFCAMSAMAANGLCPPECTDGTPTTCTIGTTRALVFGHYILIGVPLFAFTMAQIVGILIERTVRASEMRLLTRPLSSEEYTYVMELRNNKNIDDHSIHLGEFIVMELLRLRKIDQCDLELIKRLFDDIDEDQNGVIDLNELLKHSLLDAHAMQCNDPVCEVAVEISDSFKSVDGDVEQTVHQYNQVLLPYMSRLQQKTEEGIPRKISELNLNSYLDDDDNQCMSHAESRFLGRGHRPHRQRSFSSGAVGLNERSPLLPKPWASQR